MPPMNGIWDNIFLQPYTPSSNSGGNGGNQGGGPGGGPGGSDGFNGGPGGSDGPPNNMGDLHLQEEI